VAAAGGLAGSLVVAPGRADAEFRLEVPLAELTLDEPELRGRLGAGFESEPSPEDVRATRERMLGEAVLDARRHPVASVSGRLRDGALAGPILELSVTLRGVSRRLEAAPRVESAGRGVEVSGELALRQTDFGITPFSALMGALTVRDEVTVRYRLRLVAVPD
jgi:hypothetical protein